MSKTCHFLLFLEFLVPLRVIGKCSTCMLSTKKQTCGVFCCFFFLNFKGKFINIVRCIYVCNSITHRQVNYSNNNDNSRSQLSHRQRLSFTTIILVVLSGISEIDFILKRINKTTTQGIFLVSFTSLVKKPPNSSLFILILYPNSYHSLKELHVAGHTLMV